MDNRPNEMDKAAMDLESSKRKIKYPKSVFYIIGNEFCERFCYYGMRAVLVLYFTKVLALSENEATQSYHEFTMLCYFTPVIGALLADSYLGKYKTILYLSILYALGNIFLSYSSFLENGLLSLFSLGLIAFGTGGIKPCVSAFGGDQFVAGQEEQLKKFFSLFYMSINLGSLASTFITPILRSDVSCSVRGDCFPLAFGVPAALMTVATILFIAGRSSYRIVEVSKGNVLLKFFQCNIYAMGIKMKSIFSSDKASRKHDHWLDVAEDKFSPKVIKDVKSVNRILCLFVPLPLFWALFDQQGSRWTLQALKMDGIIFGETALKPDQLQVINPILIVLMVPVFDSTIYYLTDKFGLCTKPLQRMTVGGLLASLSFVLAAFLQISLESEVPRLPTPGHGHLTLVNSIPCTLNLIPTQVSMDYLKITLEPGQVHSAFELNAPAEYQFNVKSSECDFGANVSLNLDPITIKLNDGDVKGIILYPIKVKAPNWNIGIHEFAQRFPKPEQGNSMVRLVYSLPSKANNSEKIIATFSHDLFSGPTDQKEVIINETIGVADFVPIETYSGVAEYSFKTKLINSESIKIKARNGASYLLVVFESPVSGNINKRVEKIVDENRLSMLWQIPQYFVITCGEVMFSVTGLQFSYSQAPASMKSVVQAAWLLTVSFGNLMVALVTAYVKFEKQSIEFFFFAGLMALDMAIFAVMAYLYTYSDQALDDGSEVGNGSTKPIEESGLPKARSNEHQATEQQDTKL